MGNHSLLQGTFLAQGLNLDLLHCSHQGCFYFVSYLCDFPGGSDGKASAYNTGNLGSNWEDLLEKEMATHSSILAWKIPWMEDPGRLQSMGLQRVGLN